MKKFILEYICTIEGWKTAIKNLHWNADNLNQHELCDKIATTISDFQDVVSEVEQSLSGKIDLNLLKGKRYNIKTLKKFINDVITVTTKFYTRLKRRGDDYIGMRSECESFIGQMQKYNYLVDFTLKEDFKRNFGRLIKENRNIEETIDVDPMELSLLIKESLSRVIERKKKDLH